MTLEQFQDATAGVPEPVLRSSMVVALSVEPPVPLMRILVFTIASCTSWRADLQVRLYYGGPEGPPLRAAALGGSAPTCRDSEFAL